jgi:hypothetical protein
MRADTKRLNFNVTPEQEAQIKWVRDELGTPTVKVAVLQSVALLARLLTILGAGGTLHAKNASGEDTLLILLHAEGNAGPRWKYLTERAHAWRRQLYVKGRKLRAATVWLDMQVNGMTRDEAAANWELPLEAIDEIARYCEECADLIRAEAEEERLRLRLAGVDVRG